MKNILILSLVTFACYTPLSAQTFTPPSSHTELVRKIQSLNEAAAHSPYKTTAIKQRVTGSATIDAQLQIVDSMEYRYSSGRGSEFDFDELEFVERIDPGVSGKLVKSDSAYEVIHANQQSATAYNASGMPQQQLTYYGTTNIDRSTWTYNAQNKVTEWLSEWYSNSSMTWSVSERFSNVYDAQGRLVRDTTEHASQIYTGEYHYNAAGLVDTVRYYYFNLGVWDLISRYIYIYAGTQMTNSIFEGYNGTTWDKGSELIFTYSGSRKVSEQRYTWISNIWSLEREEYRHLNSNNLPDSVFFRYFHWSWDTTISKLVYNNFDNPESINYYDGSMNFVEHTRFTYQDYDPQGVKEIATAKTLTVYPNPAKEQLHIATMEMKAGRADYAITNSLGQTVMNGNDIVSGEKLAIDVSNLAPGMYWLQLQDSKGEWYRAAFSKAE